jgi:hypothetical protein
LKTLAIIPTVVIVFVIVVNLLNDRGPLPPRDPGRRPPLASHIRRPVLPSPPEARPGGPAADGHRRIPSIIHQTWKSTSAIPETFRPWIRSCLALNPDWEYWLWSDDDMRRLVSTAYPQYLELYDGYPSQSQRVDVFRYFVLYEYGGLYVDLDMECLRPIDGAIDDKDCLLSQEPVEHALLLAPVGVPLVSNALMACRPAHPFFAHVISGLRSYTRSWLMTSNNDVLSTTGPYMLTTAYHRYNGAGWWYWLRRLTAAGSSPAVAVADADVFQPSPDDSMVDYMRQVCQHQQQPASGGKTSICARLNGYDFGRRTSDKAYTTHHWTHSWVGRRNDPWGLLNEQLNRFDITELVDY